MIIAYRFEPQIPYLNFLSNTSEAKIVEWASCTLFMGSISVSIANKVLEERDGDWVIMFQLWGFLSIKSSLLRKKKLTSSPKHLIRVFWKLRLCLDWAENPRFASGVFLFFFFFSTRLWACGYCSCSAWTVATKFNFSPPSQPIRTHRALFTY